MDDEKENLMSAFCFESKLGLVVNYRAATAPSVNYLSRYPFVAMLTVVEEHAHYSDLWLLTNYGYLQYLKRRWEPYPATTIQKKLTSVIEPKYCYRTLELLQSNKVADL